jgi:hypothetical protein
MMRHQAFQLAFAGLWTLIRRTVVPQPTATSDESQVQAADAARERDQQPLRLHLF